jgi:uncharacterized protein (TIGR02646 family)
MRQLKKGEVPATIANQGAALTAAYISAPVGAKPKPWKSADIVDALKSETAHKCAYCESAVEAITWSHVEHILPRSEFPELVVEWSNLTIACPKCNNYKQDYYVADEPLIHPYEDAPENHLLFEHGTLLAQPGDEKGKRTITILHLYRLELKQRREERLDFVAGLVHSWAATSNPQLKQSVADLVMDTLDDDAEYLGFVRAFLDRVGFPWRELAA